MSFIVLRSQDSISQKSVDIQSRSDDQHSISSADRLAVENRRQSQYSSASGVLEDGSRSRTPTSKPVSLLCAHNDAVRVSVSLIDVYLFVPQRSRSSVYSPLC